MSQRRVSGIPPMCTERFSHLFFPTVEVDGAGIRRQHDELGKGDFGLRSRQCGGIEGLRDDRWAIQK